MEDKKNLKDWWAERTKNQKYLIIGGIILLMIIGALTDDKPKKSYSKNSSSSRSNNNQMTHRCGRTFSGKIDKNYEVYGDYCCLNCYADLYPN